MPAEQSFLPFHRKRQMLSSDFWSHMLEKGLAERHFRNGFGEEFHHNAPSFPFAKLCLR
jgi:hypothetical protein